MIMMIMIMSCFCKSGEN